MVRGKVGLDFHRGSLRNMKTIALIGGTSWESRALLLPASPMKRPSVDSAGVITLQPHSRSHFVERGARCAVKLLLRTGFAAKDLWDKLQSARLAHRDLNLKLHHIRRNRILVPHQAFLENVIQRRVASAHLAINVRDQGFGCASG